MRKVYKGEWLLHIKLGTEGKRREEAWQEGRISTGRRKERRGRQRRISEKWRCAKGGKKGRWMREGEGQSELCLQKWW